MPGRFRVEAGYQLRRAFDISEEHGDLLALTGQGGAGVENFLGQVRGRVGVRGTHWLWGRRQGAASVTCPDQDPPRLIGGEVLRLDEFIPQRL